ncbi:MAG: flavin reductase family protein [Treponema sp.]|nr:flavin reductase family protein [Treponema sp.]
MKKNFGKQTYLYPMPVLIVGTYDENGHPDAMNAAWGGIHDTNQIGICLSAEHKTVKNLLKSKVFTVCIADEAHVKACDYVGIVSGNTVPDKFERAGFTATKGEFVNAPVINELPMCLECELVSYEEETGCLVGNIINVSADESVLTDGKIDVSKLKPITYDPVNHNYVGLGAIVGKAFSDGKLI